MVKKCSGCGGCVAICPKDCISLELNNKGFYKAKINDTKCIKCGLCEKMCPMNVVECNSLDKSELYSTYSCDDVVREKSSSGGVAYLLAEYGMKNDYIICGCTYDYSLHEAKHIIINNFQELSLIQGSKYLQSNTTIFREIIYIGRRNKNTKFMVFGTPCQISSLKKIVEFYNIEAQFLLIDIFCHGVPSYLLWNKYLKWLERRGINNSKIRDICFRDKKYSWHEYFMHIVTDEKEYVASRKKDPFLKIFSMGVMNQKECFTCQYRNKSEADIRLGDYWGERYKKSEKGYSMTLLNSYKGEKIFKKFLKENSVIYKKMPIDDRLGQQHSDYPIPKYYEKSFEVLLKTSNSMNKIINMYDPLLTRLKRTLKKMIENIKN